MHSARFAIPLLAAACALAQPPSASPPDFVRQAQQFIRQGKLDYALSVYVDELNNSPDSYYANLSAGELLDLMGKGSQARDHLNRAIQFAPSAEAKARALRSMAMSWGFEGNCAKTVQYEQQVIDHWATLKDFYQQGEIADEGARVCLDSGDYDTAYQWYKKGHDLGLQQPDITPDRTHLWEFRWEHAQARIAARRGQAAEAEKHVAAAKALLDADSNLAAQQAVFFPYLKGYVAFYLGDTPQAVADLLQANQNDAFIQCLLGQAYEKLGQQEEAMKYYRKAAETTAHNPPAAYARPFTRKKLR